MQHWFYIFGGSAESLDNLNQLRPVQFTFKDNPDNHLEYGLIAEEVAEIYPELVVYKDGKVHTIRYHLLTPLLLADIIRKRREFQADIADAKARLTVLENAQ